VPIPQHPRGIEDRLLEIEANEVAGFGGAYVDSLGDVVAFVTDLHAAPRAQAAVARLIAGMPDVGRRKDGQKSEIRIRKGEFSMSQLVTWQEALRDAAVFQHGATLLDADEGQNRVRVGIADEAARRAVESIAAGAGVPRSALSFEARPGVTQMATSLGDRVRPTTAGLEIRRWLSSTVYSKCTMAFNVTDDTGKAYFLTASHCTGHYNGPAGAQFHQVNFSSSNLLGTESVNPAWSTNCSSGASYCRNTDVALIAYNSGVTWNRTVVETQVKGSGTLPGNLTIYRNYNVIGDGDAMQGVTVAKTGSTTGTTEGVVTGTCVDPGITDVGTEVLCSHEASMYSAKGDSGGPVWAWAPPLASNNTTDRFARGVYWGFLYPGPGQTPKIYYSPWSLIVQELGVPLRAYAWPF
jgi:hypothetical protein